MHIFVMVYNPISTSYRFGSMVEELNEMYLRYTRFDINYVEFYGANIQNFNVK